MPDHLAPLTPPAGGTVWPRDPDVTPDVTPDAEGGGAVPEAPAAVDGDRWAVWDSPRPFNRLSAVLAVALVAVLAFGGGVLLQQKTGTSSGTATGARPGGLPAGFSGYGRQGYGGQGFPGQGFPGQGAGGQGFPGQGAGGQGFPGQGGLPGAGGSAGSGSGSGSGSAAGGTTSAPVAVGTVAALSPSGSSGAGTLTVKTFGGTTVVVSVPATATVTATGLAGRLAVGSRVVVHGTRGSDGKVTASALTVR